jgi:hypothetical protein
MSPSLLFKTLLAAATIAAVSSTPTGTPEEGMWTFDNLPLKQLKEKYGFEPTKEWIDHVRMSSIKFEEASGGGGSASFVSPKGLLMTNHHVAMSTLQKLYNQNKKYDYVALGFSAKEYGQEVKAPGFRLKQLVEIKDVTKDVAEKTKDAAPGDRPKMRAGIMKELQEQHSDKSKSLSAEAVSLYQGSVQQIYVYRTWDDVRLVFAPEKQVAFYGGDYDNFTFPRYCLDAAFFRVYENDKAIDTSKSFFKWSAKGAQKDDLVFVPGNPGSTNRAMTYSELEMLRDVILPLVLKQLREQLAATDAMMKKDPEGAGKELRDQYFGLSNSLKAYEGRYRGLKDVEMMAKKKGEEDAFIKAAGDPAVTEAFAKITKAQTAEVKLRERVPFYRIRGLISRFDQKPTPFQQFVMDVREGKKEFSGTLELSPSAQATIAGALDVARNNLPKDDVFVKAFLGDKTGADAAAAFAKSKLFDESFRADLLKGGAEALAKVDDPLLVALRDSQPALEELAALKKSMDDAKGTAYDVIAAARFKVFGTSIYPDATFTLRLSYGSCKGYEAGTTQVPWKTTFHGLFERNSAFENAEPFDLPKRWTEGRTKLDLDTPYNFVCTTDIIGGNSGSPIINREGEAVGLVFDGNIESLPGDYWFDERINRTVAVHTAGITEALKGLYGETDLVGELLGSK